MKTTLGHAPASGSAKGADSKLSHEPPPGRSWDSSSGLWRHKTTVIAAISIGAEKVSGTNGTVMRANLSGRLPRVVVQALLSIQYVVAPSAHAARFSAHDSAIRS